VLWDDTELTSDEGSDSGRGGADSPQSELKANLGPLVEPAQRPHSAMQLYSPASWSVQELRAWRDHIHNSQQGVLAPERQFQFSWTDTGEKEDEYQTLAHPQSSLRYDGRSRLWVARILKKAPLDALAQDELIFQLPELPLCEEQYVPWADDIELALCARVSPRSNLPWLLALV
jgi:hypothetical protein